MATTFPGNTTPDREIDSRGYQGQCGVDEETLGHAIASHQCPPAEAPGRPQRYHIRRPCSRGADPGLARSKHAGTASRRAGPPRRPVGPPDEVVPAVRVSGCSRPDTRSRTGSSAGRITARASPPAQCAPADLYARTAARRTSAGRVRAGLADCHSANRAPPMYQADSLAAPNR